MANTLGKRTVKLPNHVHIEAKVQAIRLGQFLDDWIADAVIEKLKRAGVSIPPAKKKAAG